MRQLRVALAATLLLALACPIGTLLGGEGQAGAASDGIVVGKRFTIPIVVAGKAVRGRAVVTADRLLVIDYPAADGLSVEELVYSLTRQDGAPEPGPSPKPPPTPIVKPTRVLIVAETKNAPVKLAAVYTSKVWRDEAKSLGMAAAVGDPTGMETTYPGALARAKKVGIPAVLFMDDVGFVTAAEKCPDSIDAMTALVRKAGGKP